MNSASVVVCTRCGPFSNIASTVALMTLDRVAPGFARSMKTPTPAGRRRRPARASRAGSRSGRTSCSGRRSPTSSGRCRDTSNSHALPSVRWKIVPMIGTVADLPAELGSSASSVADDAAVRVRRKSSSLPSIERDLGVAGRTRSGSTPNWAKKFALVLVVAAEPLPLADGFDAGHRRHLLLVGERQVDEQADRRLHEQPVRRRRPPTPASAPRRSTACSMQSRNTATPPTAIVSSERIGWPSRLRQRVSRACSVPRRGRRALLCSMRPSLPLSRWMTWSA